MTIVMFVGGIDTSGSSSVLSLQACESLERAAMERIIQKEFDRRETWRVAKSDPGASVYVTDAWFQNNIPGWTIRFDARGAQGAVHMAATVTCSMHIEFSIRRPS
ncbi:hypothetical protein [Aureimonas mangrovi]|uniref:hypothetical protein n=1 Tax=Aureimonas mangrovi TaxID=2758041 RepID=UPI00163D4E53|nr:hypothetical protein [Aureimonas mangrovi]